MSVMVVLEKAPTTHCFVLRSLYPRTVYEQFVGTITNGAVHSDSMLCTQCDLDHAGGMLNSVFSIGGDEDDDEDDGGDWVSSKASAAARESKAKAVQMTNLQKKNPPRAAVGGCDGRRFVFTAYMYQPFSMNIVSRAEMEDPNYRNVYLRLTEEEFQKCSSYFQTWVSKALPYNYSDTLIGIPTVSPDGEVSKTIFQARAPPFPRVQFVMLHI